MTEEQLELHVELRTDALDRVYLNTDMTEAEYKQKLREIETWANVEFRSVPVLMPRLLRQ